MKLIRALLLSSLLATPAFALDPGTPAIASSQTTVAATATLVAIARPSRSSVTIVNGAAADVFCGGSTVTTTTGVLLVGTKGASLKFDTRAEVYCVVAAATTPVSAIESY